MVQVHPSSIIDPKAEIADDVVIGPFCTVGPNVKIGSKTKLTSHVVLTGNTVIGKNNEIFPFVTIGTETQHKSLEAHVDDAKIFIGDDNIFREYFTGHTGSHISHDHATHIGSRNLFLAYTHVAHDCIIGNDIVMSNCATLAGHVEVGDRAIIGGLSAVLQFTKIGRGAMIGGMAGVFRDVIPYGIVMGGGQRNGLAGLNLIGLQRAGVEKDKIFELQKVYKALFDKNDVPFAERLAQLASSPVMENPLVKEVIEFVQHPSKNGVLLPEEEK